MTLLLISLMITTTTTRLQVLFPVVFLVEALGGVGLGLGLARRSEA